MGKKIDLKKKRFGKLVIIDKSKKQDKFGNMYWWCQCDCGKSTYVSTGNLKSGNTKSCGCLNREKGSKKRIKHGMARTRIYKVWFAMKNRCQNPNVWNYERYGGRGIRVCDRWQNFINFWFDMGDRPEGTTLDRKDNEGNYEPGNCRWATPKEQQQNMRSYSKGPNKQNWFVGWNDDLGEWDEDNNQHDFAKRYGLSNKNISQCLSGEKNIHKGWQFERIEL